MTVPSPRTCADAMYKLAVAESERNIFYQQHVETLDEDQRSRGGSL